jgi:dihydrofolate synthase/folylpolyglutamate synthase
VRTTLTDLGNPHHQFLSLAIAGTNGKGSTAAMVDRTLAAHGVRTGLYTSPHLVRVEERCRLDGCDVSAEQLLAALEPLHRRVELSFFETVTIAALILFAEHRVRWAVLEAGMGGRWDATRAADPKVVGLTNVGTDHSRWLGASRGEIAAEKGALARDAEVTVLGPGIDDAIIPALGVERFVRAADLVAVAPLEEQRVAINLEGARFTAPMPLPGRHQLDNLTLALALATTVCHLEGYGPLQQPRVEHALSTVRWPGRLAALEVAGRRVLVDGAHNLEAAEALAHHLLSCPYRYNLLFSCLEDKPAQAMAAALGPAVGNVAVCPLPDPRSASSEALQAAFADAVPAPDPLSALAQLPDPVLAAGSLRLVGHLIEHASAPTS